MDNNMLISSESNKERLLCDIKEIAKFSDKELRIWCVYQAAKCGESVGQWDVPNMFYNFIRESKIEKLDIWDLLLEITDLAREIDRDHPEELEKFIPDIKELKTKLSNQLSHLK